jgi:hypothetical protein
VETKSPVVTFAELFLAEANRQDEKEKKDGLGKDDIVVTDSQCRPGG